MSKKMLLPSVLLSAFLLTSLFYKQGIGLNLLIFEILFISWLFFTRQINFLNKNLTVTAIATCITAIATVVNYSTYTYWVHFICLVIFVGVLNFANARSLLTALGISFRSLFKAPQVLISQLAASKINGRKTGRLVWQSRIFIAPISIIVVFIVIYSLANPVFADMVFTIFRKTWSALDYIFSVFDLALILTFIVGLLISAYLFIRIRYIPLEKADLTASDYLHRIKVRVRRHFRLTALKNELKAAIFLLTILNLMLLVLNGMDIYWVWFNFEWKGETLKEFVHEGTYLLITSILISMAVILYFFRGKLNFYRNNQTLKVLSYIWLFQNGILALSAGMRNFWYIEYYNLAYKRIGVVVFLLLTLFGLYTIFKKIRYKKSPFYLFRTNALAIFIALVITSVVNWDPFIVKYNFAHADQSYLHLEYLVELSDKTLPYLDRSASEMMLLSELQKKKFRFYDRDMTNEEYLLRIAHRKRQFKDKWESKNLLSWNLAEYRAYRKLFKNTFP